VTGVATTSGAPSAVSPASVVGAAAAAAATAAGQVRCDRHDEVVGDAEFLVASQAELVGGNLLLVGAKAYREVVEFLL